MNLDIRAAPGLCGMGGITATMVWAHDFIVWGLLFPFRFFKRRLDIKPMGGFYVLLNVSTEP